MVTIYAVWLVTQERLRDSEKKRFFPSLLRKILRRSNRSARSARTFTWFCSFSLEKDKESERRKGNCIGEVGKKACSTDYFQIRDCQLALPSNPDEEALENECTSLLLQPDEKSPQWLICRSRCLKGRKKRTRGKIPLLKTQESHLASLYLNCCEL